MTQDKHKGFVYTYNCLNLPATMTNGANVITITYTADGEKLSKAITGGGATKNYVSGIEYSGANVEAIYHAEGRLTTTNNIDFSYEYTLKDHLGNARISFRAITNGTAIQTLQENHYYPFGMEMEGAWQAQVGVENPYQYNGKELNEDFGLNLMDYGARWYDAAIGRWGSVDPIQKFGESLYTSFSNNPIILIDPIGADTSFSNVATKNEFNKTYEKVGNKISSLDKKSVQIFEKWRKEGFDPKSKNISALENITTTRSELIEIKESLDEIIQSTTMFFISGETNADGSVRESGGSTEYNHLKNRVDISYGLGNDHTLVHEVRHGAGVVPI